MKTTGLSAILTCVNLLLVKGHDLKTSVNRRSASFGSRILYGQPADISEFPYIVKLLIGSRFGAGSIIANEWVLTAAHCIVDVDCSTVEIVPAAWPPGLSVVGEECIPHSDYHLSTDQKYDIGLVRIIDDFLASGTAAIIPLPSPGTICPIGTRVVTAGWGITEQGTVSNELLKTELLVEDWNVCNTAYLAIQAECQENIYCTPTNIPVRILCTKGEGVPTAGDCFGDSGGPVVADGALAGIVSFGPSVGNVCPPGSPSMQTAVVDYLPWIYSYIDPSKDVSQIVVRPEERE